MIFVRKFVEAHETVFDIENEIIYYSDGSVSDMINSSKRKYKLKGLFAIVHEESGFVMTREFYEYLKNTLIYGIHSDDLELYHRTYKNHINTLLTKIINPLNS